MRHQGSKGFIGVLVVLLTAGLIGWAIWFNIYAATNHHQVIFSVDKSERVVSSDGKSAKYMIYTDQGVYQNTDSIFNGKYNSADMYNNLKVGHKYSCDVVGFRNGFWSMFENVIQCKEVK